MSISVTFKDQSYIVSHEGKEVAALPQIYLDGALAPNGNKASIHKEDIELAFAKAYGYGQQAKNFETDLQRRHFALAELGLIREPA